jgi:uncharacterized protein
MPISRRSLLRTGGFVTLGSMASVVTSRSRAAAGARNQKRFSGYGSLRDDSRGLVNLPAGFRYRVFSRAGDRLTSGGRVPDSHDGMGAFPAGLEGTWLVRNHELDTEAVEEDGLRPVRHLPGATYDRDGVGGTTSLLVGHDRSLLSHDVSLAGTLGNCAGGPTPWLTWLTCEEDDSVLGRRHGYVFEVDPSRGGNPVPIRAMGRFEHEALAFDSRGRAYLTEDAGDPHGCFYRFQPDRPLGGLGSLHAGGALGAMAVAGVDDDLSIVQQPGSAFPVAWVPVPNPDPGEDGELVREQVLDAGATPIQKAEGAWAGLDGSIWFVSSYGGGPDADEKEDRSAAAHSGQIWRYRPDTDQIELVALFPEGGRFDGPDNITAGPHGFALACTDGDDDQRLVGIDDEGGTFPFALNVRDGSEFAGVTFSPDGQTLFVNMQGSPALTLAIFGPWVQPG